MSTKKINFQIFMLNELSVRQNALQINNLFQILLQVPRINKRQCFIASEKFKPKLMAFTLASICFKCRGSSKRSERERKINFLPALKLAGTVSCSI